MSLTSEPFSLADHYGGTQDQNMIIERPYGPVHIIYWERGIQPFGLRQYMTEVKADSVRSGHVLVDETTGFYVVSPDQSVIFVSDHNGEWWSIF